MEPQKPMANVKSDMNKLRRNATASAGELREFLAQMRGKSPREMLGAVATSNLGKSLAQAAAGVAAAIIILTLIPFVLGKIFPAKQPASLTQEKAQPAHAAANERNDPTPPEPPLNPDTKTHKALDKLGIGETKDAPLSENPLDDQGDDILKDLK